MHILYMSHTSHRITKTHKHVTQTWPVTRTSPARHTCQAQAHSCLSKITPTSHTSSTRQAYKPSPNRCDRSRPVIGCSQRSISSPVTSWSCPMALSRHHKSAPLLPHSVFRCLTSGGGEGEVEYWWRKRSSYCFWWWRWWSKGRNRNSSTWKYMKHREVNTNTQIQTHKEIHKQSSNTHPNQTCMSLHEIHTRHSYNGCRHAHSQSSHTQSHTSHPRHIKHI
jgi:hypothetical protein